LRTVRSAIIFTVLCVALLGPLASGTLAIPLGSTISGLITTSDAAPAVGVHVGLYLGDSPVAHAYTGGDGRYIFNGVADGLYTVRPSSSTLCFSPGYLSVVAPPGTTTADFVGSYFIAGYVKTAGGAPIAGVSMGLYQNDTLQRTSYTYSNGRYYFINLPAGNYTVKPALTGKVFSPVSRDVTLPPSSTSTDFVGADQTYHIGGTVTAEGGGPLAGVYVHLYHGDTKIAQTTTDPTGQYSFSGLAAGSYTVRPLSNTIAFSPGSRAVSVPPDNDTTDFVGSCVIAGNVKTAAGAPMPNVGVGLYLADTLVKSALTGGTGRYYFLHLAPGNYTVKLLDAGLVSDPVSRAVSVPPGSYTADFTVPAAAYAISGTIKTSAGAPAPGVPVELYQGQALMTTTTTDADGKYVFSHLGGGSYTVHPNLPGTSFSPYYRTVTVGPSRSGVDFTMGPQTFSIGGVIKTVGGSPVPGISVGLYVGAVLQTSTTTGGDGRYSFTGLAAGTYTVHPSHSYVSFDPPYRTVTVGPSTDSANFTAASVLYTISGLIRTAEGTAVPNISVGLYQDGVVKQQAVTNGEGRYTFTGVMAGNYAVKPSASGTTFDPTYRSVTVGPSQDSVNFTVTATIISGLSYNATGGPMAGVAVSLYHEITLVAYTVTNSGGRYYFLNVPAGTYRVVPSHDGNLFDPYYRMVTVPPPVIDANFHSTN